MRTHGLSEVMNDKYDQVHVFYHEYHPHLHILDAYACSSGLNPADRTLSWAVPPEEALWAAGVLDGLKGPLIGLHPASNTATRSLGPATIRELVERLGRDFGATVLITGERPLGLEGCLDLSGRLQSLAQVGALLARMDGFITVDSGPFHLAQALGTPTAAVFGCTLPELRTTRTDRVQILTHGALPCLGCYHDLPPGSEVLPGCARGDLACMLEPEAGAILAALRRALDGVPDRALEARIAAYEARRPALLAASADPEATREACWTKLRALDKRLGGFKRFRRKVRALFQPGSPG